MRENHGVDAYHIESCFSVFRLPPFCNSLHKETLPIFEDTIGLDSFKTIFVTFVTIFCNKPTADL